MMTRCTHCGCPCSVEQLQVEQSTVCPSCKRSFVVGPQPSIAHPPSQPVAPQESCRLPAYIHMVQWLAGTIAFLAFLCLVVLFLHIPSQYRSQPRLFLPFVLGLVAMFALLFSACEMHRPKRRWTRLIVLVAIPKACAICLIFAYEGLGLFRHMDWLPLVLWAVPCLVTAFLLSRGRALAAWGLKNTFMTRGGGVLPLSVVLWDYDKPEPYILLCALMFCITWIPSRRTIRRPAKGKS
jgi:hypothetical protein